MRRREVVGALGAVAALTWRSSSTGAAEFE
jgi:hypothetical protein